MARISQRVHNVENLLVHVHKEKSLRLFKLGESSLHAFIKTAIVIWNTTQVDERLPNFAGNIGSHIPLEENPVRKKDCTNFFSMSNLPSSSPAAVKNKRTCARLHPTPARLERQSRRA